MSEELFVPADWTADHERSRYEIREDETRGARIFTARTMLDAGYELVVTHDALAPVAGDCVFISVWRKL